MAPSSPRFSLTLVIAVFAGTMPVVEAGSLRKSTLLSVAEAETSLVSELAGGVSAARLAELEDALRPTYESLPKHVDGNLGHQAVRYVLHRLFVQRHSWYIRGLEPSDDVPPPYLHGEWVPAYLQGLLEQRLGEGGIDLQLLAALAAALEDLVYKEVYGQLASVYELHGLDATASIDSRMTGDVLSTYMMLYLRGGNFTLLGPDELEFDKLWFSSHYADWPKVEVFLDEIEGRHLNASYDRTLDFTAAARMVSEISQRFGSFNDGECRNLKSALLKIEGQTNGRVRLSDFYKTGAHSHWNFNEKTGYLRTIGALDESDPSQPRIIVPNYISSRTNCLEASSLYAVCCRNECEDLMGHLEGVIGGPTAGVGRVVELVAALSSDTVVAPRNISATLLNRLGDIAEGNGGHVPLHGRLFAQWMHHAFPLECPYPHEAGTINPQTPDEWIKETGGDDHRVSEEEVQWHMANFTCNETSPCAAAELDPDIFELPWSDVEEIFANRPLRRAAHHSPYAVFLIQCTSVALGLFLGGGYVAHRRTASVDHCERDSTRSEKHGAQRLPKVDLPAVLVLCLYVAAADAAGFLHKTAFGFGLVGGFVFVALPGAAGWWPSQARTDAALPRFV